MRRSEMCQPRAMVFERTMNTAQLVMRMEKGSTVQYRGPLKRQEDWKIRSAKHSALSGAKMA